MRAACTSRGGQDFGPSVPSFCTLDRALCALGELIATDFPLQSWQGG